MEYTKQTWTAPTGTGLSRYAKSAESASHVTLTLDPENLTNSPTPFTMARMAHMEEGIAKAYDTAPPTPWAQYSGKDIPQIPDNVAGTTYKRDNDWTTTDGWERGHTTIALSVEDNTLKMVYDGTRPDTGLSIQKNIDATGMFIKGHIKCTVPIINVRYYTGSAVVSFTLATPNAYETDFYGYIPIVLTSVLSLYINYGQLTAKTCWLSQLYIGTGAYDRLVFDNSYHYRHLLNNAVIPTPQGLYFNGAGSYLRSKEKVSLPDVFTFSATVNCAVSMTTFQRIFETASVAVYRSSNSTAISVRYYNTNTASFTQVYINNFFIDNTDIDTKIEIDFISEKIKVYRNNTLFYSGSVPYIQNTTESYLYIGATESLLTNYFLGYMRNICFFDTALTDTQRNWLAQGNTPPILYDVTNYVLANLFVRVSLRHGNTWFDKTWTGLSVFSGNAIWTDGDNIYYSNGTNQYVLNKVTSTWVAKTWTGLTNFSGENIWTDGNNTYYSKGTVQFVLNKATSTWTAKTWTGLTDFNGNAIWTDGDNIYYSTSTTHYVLNKTTSTWTTKAWTGFTDFNGRHIWTDGDNIYYSFVTEQYVLNKATNTWSLKTWTGLTSFNGNQIRTDGDNIYYSNVTTQFVLNKATNTWVAKTWTGLTSFNGNLIWTDGENIYYSAGTLHYVLPATRHNYIDDAKYNSLFGTVTTCNCSTLSDGFVFRNE